jgi:hypothetical protein
MLAGLSLAAALPLLPVGEGDAGAMRAYSFPEIVIRKGETGHEWPFSIDEGELTCLAYQGQRYVFFAEILTDDEMGTFGAMTLPRSVVVSTNPVALFASFEDRALYAPWDSLETLVTRLAPYELMGRALCDDTDDDL